VCGCCTAQRFQDDLLQCGVWGMGGGGHVDSLEVHLSSSALLETLGVVLGEVVLLEGLKRG